MDIAMISAIVVGLTQIFKTFGFNERLTPIFALVAGVALNTLVGVGGVWEQALWGIVAGLTAMGFWSGSKAILGK